MPAKSMRLRVITSNVSADFLAPPGVPRWDDRKSLYAQVLRDKAPDLVALQEAMPSQLQYLRAELPEFTALTVKPANPDPAMLIEWRAKYARFGFTALPDPYEVALLFRSEVFELLEAGHWWLSPTPERPSIGFGNIAPRVVQWARLSVRATGRELVIFNTHLDHRCLDPMVGLCCEKLAGLALGDTPCLFAGDLNFNPDAENFHRLQAAGWHDSHAVAGEAPDSTFLYNDPAVPSGRIDHILYHGPGLTPLTWNRLESPDPSRRLSDHDPVQASFRLA